MKNRLVTAKDLLTSNGSIFVQCDNNEFSYLSILLDEVFGRANFVNVISVKSSTPSGVKTSHANKKILKSQDFIFVYKKSEFLIKPQFTKKDKWDTHYMFYVRNNKLIKLVDVLKEENLLNEKQNLKHFDVNDKKHKAFYIANGDNIVRKSTHDNKAIKSACNNEYKDKIYNSNNNLFLNNDMLQPISKSFQTVLDGQNLTEDISNLLCDFWSDIDFQNTQNQGGVSFPAGKKPEQLLYRIIDMVTEPNDIVLDFHLGSGTTAAVAHKMKRQYIGIEQMDYIQNISTKRLTNVINGENGGISTALSWNGGGEFLYFELKKYNQSFVEKIEEAKDTKSLLNIWEMMKEKSFLNYNINIKAQDGNIEEFKSLELTQQKELLVELLDKNQMYVNLSSMDDSDFEVTDEEKKITKAFYNLNKM